MLPFLKVQCSLQETVLGGLQVPFRFRHSRTQVQVSFKTTSSLLLNRIQNTRLKFISFRQPPAGLSSHPSWSCIQCTNMDWAPADCRRAIRWGFSHEQHRFRQAGHPRGTEVQMQGEKVYGASQVRNRPSHCTVSCSTLS